MTEHSVNYALEILTRPKVQAVTDQLGLLKLVRELLSDPQRWTTGKWAENAQRKTVEAYERDAVCWCLGGAVRRVTSEVAENVKPKLYIGTIKMLDAILNAVGEIMPDTRLWQTTRIDKVAQFNDDAGTTHADVIAVLDRAIELLEERTRVDITR